MNVEKNPEDIVANEDDLAGNSVEALQASWLERVDGLRTYLVSPVHDAAAKGNVERLQELLREGVDVNFVDKHYAAGAGHKEAVKFLLDNQADPNLQNLMGDTPLHRAAFRNFSTVAKILLENGCQPQITNTMNRQATELTEDKETLEILHMYLFIRKAAQFLPAGQNEDMGLDYSSDSNSDSFSESGSS